MTDFVEFTCPHCSKNIRTNSRYLGMQGQCPHCTKPVKVEAPAGQILKPAIIEAPALQPTTHANTILAGVIGVATTVGIYALLLLFSAMIPGNWVSVLFLERGPIQFIITFVTCWGLAILALKYISVRQQLGYTELELEFIPLELGFKIEPKNVGEFLKHLDGLPMKAKQSILGRRIHGALQHFRERSSVPEVQAYLASHGGIDASMVDSGYTLLRAFIWAIPLFGFIGTVTGISTAVTGLADSLKTVSPDTGVAPSAPAVGGAQPGEPANLGGQMIKAMGLVTQGLATAFDTTFLGLVTAILLLFPTESLKRIEYAMLDRIETFTNDSLLRRMSDDADPGLSPEVARLLDPVFKRHQQWLMEWQNQVGDLGNVIGQDFEKHAANIQHHLERRENEKASELLQAMQSLSQAVLQTRELMQRFQATSSAVSGDVTASLDKLQQASVVVSANLKSMLDNAAELQKSLATNNERMAELTGRQPQAAPRGAENGRLEQVLDSLDRHVAHLAQAIAQAEPVFPLEPGNGRGGPGWWPFGRQRPGRPMEDA